MKRPHGFTLLEVIVAFALLALALTLLLGSLSGAARQVREAEDASRATLHAQSLLATFDGGEPAQPGRRQGRFDEGRYTWTLDIAPYADPPPPGGGQVVDPYAPRLMALDLSVRWGDGPGQRLHWQTLRLVPADVNQGATR